MAKDKNTIIEDLENQNPESQDNTQSTQTGNNNPNTANEVALEGVPTLDLEQINLLTTEEVVDAQKDIKELIERINNIIEQGDANRNNALALNNNEKDVEADVRDAEESTTEEVTTQSAPTDNIDTTSISQNEDDVQQFLENLNQVLQVVESTLTKVALNNNEADVNADVRDTEENTDTVENENTNQIPDDAINDQEIVANQNEVQEFIENLDQVLTEIESSVGFNQLNNNEADVTADTREKEDSPAEPVAPQTNSAPEPAIELESNEGNVEADLREPELPPAEPEEVVEEFEPEPEPEPEPEIIVEPTMSISNVVIEEGSTAKFNVTLSVSKNEPYKVYFNSTTNGSAESEDIDSNSIVVKDSNGTIIPKNSDGSYDVPAGETNLTVEIETKDDSTFEGPETFELNGKTEFMDNDTSGTGTIKDDGSANDGDDKNDVDGDNGSLNNSDDDRPSLSVNDVTVNEGAGTLTFKVILTGNTEVDSSVNYSITDGTAGSNDYSANSALSGTLNFPVGTSVKDVVLNITNDNIYEISENLNITLTNPVNAKISDANAVGTILDNGLGGDDDANNSDNSSDTSKDDDKPTLTLSDASIDEGSTLIFDGSLSNPTAFDEEITLSVANIDAEVNDYYSDKSLWTITYNNGANTLDINSSGTFTLPAGITDFKVNIPTNSDDIYEGAETFKLKANATSTYINDLDTAIGTILDDGTGTDGDDTDTDSDNDKPQMTIADITVEEGSTAIFEVQVGEAENDYTVTFSLGNVDTTTGNSDTLVDDYNVTFVVKDSNGNVISENTDGSYTVPAGATLGYVEVVTYHNTVFEGPEKFKLFGKTEFMSTDTFGTATILDDGTGPNGDNADDEDGFGSDPNGSDNDKPTILVSNVTVTEGDDAKFTISLSNQSKFATEMSLTLVDDSALSASDYDNSKYSLDGTNWDTLDSSTRVTVPALTSSIDVYIRTTEDASPESIETFDLTVNVTSDTSYVKNTSATGTATILDDDGSSIFTINDIVVNEATGTATLTVTMTPTSGTNYYKVDFATSDGVSSLTEFGAVQPDDYTSTSGTLTFLPNESTKDIVVTINDDNIYEISEFLNVTLSNVQVSTDSTDGSNGTWNSVTGYDPIPDPIGKITILDNGQGSGGTNDDMPTMSLPDVVEDEGSTLTFTATISNPMAFPAPITVSVSDITTEGSEDYDVSSLKVYFFDTTNSNAKTELTATNGVYTVPAMTTQLEITIDSENDNIYEKPEDLNLRIDLLDQSSQSIGYVEATGTILDDGSDDGDDNDGSADDDTPQMTIGNVTVEEGSTAVFDVTVGEAADDYTVTFFTSTNGSAESNDISSVYVVKKSDGTIIPKNGDGSYTVPAAETSLKVEVTTISDDVFENIETFELNGKTEYMTSNTQGTGTITDNGTGTDGDDNGGTGTDDTDSESVDDDRPTLTFEDATVEEGSTIVFNGALSNATEFNEVITLSTDVDGSYTSESNDFSSDKTTWTVTYVDTNNITQTLSVNSSGEFTLPAGIKDFKVKIPTTTDNIYEGPEDFLLSGDATSSYITDTDTAVGIITDNGSGTDGDDSDSSVDNDMTRFVINDKQVNEGESITFTVTRTGDAEANQTVDYDITFPTNPTSSQASANDLVETSFSGTLTFAPGETSKTITYNTVADSIGESDENFTVTLSNNSAGSMIQDAEGVGTIKETNSPPEAQDKTIPLAKNTSYVVTYDDLGYSDPDGDPLTKIQIASLNLDSNDNDGSDADSALLYFDGSSWVTLTSSNISSIEITKEDLDNGYLVFKPGTNEVGIAHSSFGFKVSDGQVFDTSVETITFNIQNTLSVSDPFPVDETKSAVFVISLDEARTGANGVTLLDLTLGGTTTSGTDYNTQLQYKDSSGNWVDVTNNQVSIADGKTSIEVKVKTLEDGVLDNNETLNLTASINSQSNTDTTTDMANTSDTGSTTVNDYASIFVETKDYITEGEFAVFEIRLSEIKISDTNISVGGSGVALMGTDYSQNFEYSTDGGKTWITMTSFDLTIPGSSTSIPSIMVRTLTTDDSNPENSETLTLNVSTTDTEIVTKNTSATTNIIDRVKLTVYEDGDDTNLTSQSNSVTLTDSNNEYTFTVLGQGNYGTVTQSGDDLIYTPDSDYSGTDSFTYIKTNVNTGISVQSTADVTIYANADAPDISINITNAEIEDIFDSTVWFINNSNTASLSSANYYFSGDTIETQSATITLNKKGYMLNSFDIESGTNLDLAFTDTGSTIEVYWAYYSGDPAVKISDVIAVTYNTDGSITVPTLASGTANILILGNASTNSSTDISGISLTQFVDSSSKLYDVNIYNSLTDIDNESSGTVNIEELQDITLQVKSFDGTAVIDSEGYFNVGTYNTSTDTWTFTQTQLDNLQVTVPSSLDTSGFQLVATATSKELGNTPYSVVTTYNSRASNSASVIIQNADDRPEIGDINLTVANQTNLSTTLTNVIETYYSTDTGNTFSWESALANIPDLYVDGQKMEFSYVGNIAYGKVGTTTYLTITANMDGTDGQTLTVTDFEVAQADELFGLQTLTDGDIVLPGGGNLDSVVLAFETSQSDTSVAVDCLVVAHNTIEDAPSDFTDSDAEHTVNTNNYYIGVDSNNMNAGDQLIMDFAATAASYTHSNQPATTSYHEISSIVIDLFNFNSDLTVANPDELKVTLTKVDGSTEIINIVNSMLTPSYNGVSGDFYTIETTDGQAFTQIQFDAGSTSSYKLGIAAIGSISYDKDFDIELGYSITDTDGDKDTGTATISFNGDDSITDTSGDSYILYQDGVSIDAGTGFDTLVLDSGIDIDLSTAASLTNFEAIDLTQEGDHDILNITLGDVLDNSGSESLSTILGDTGDNVSLKSENGNDWTTDGVTDSNGFKTYVNDANGGTAVSLKIDADISVSII